MKNLKEFKQWAKARNIVYSIQSATTNGIFIYHLIKLHGLIQSDIKSLHLFGTVQHKEYYYISIKDKNVPEDESLIKLENFL